MKVIVVGCGRVGSTLAYQSYRLGHEVVVIDQDGSAFDHLPGDFQGRTVEGDALTRDVLRRAEVEGADALVAATNSDALNALVARVAKTEYGVGRAVARNVDPRQRPLQEAFEVTVVGSISWGPQRIEEWLSDAPLHVVYEDHRANITIYRLEVPGHWAGRTVQVLLPEARGGTLALVRAGRHLPEPDTQIVEAGDEIYLSAEPHEIDALRGRLSTPPERPE